MPYPSHSPVCAFPCLRGLGVQSPLATDFWHRGPEKPLLLFLLFASFCQWALEQSQIPNTPRLFLRHASLVTEQCALPPRSRCQAADDGLYRHRKGRRENNLAVQQAAGTRANLKVYASMTQSVCPSCTGYKDTCCRVCHNINC